MNKIELIEEAKFYSQNLLLGIEPITGMRISENNPYNTEKMRKYFSFVSDILQEVLDNKGTVFLGANEELISFSLSDSEKKLVEVTYYPIKITSFVNRINKVVDQNKMKRLSLYTLNKWLIKNDYIIINKDKKTIQKRQFWLCEKAQSCGFTEKKFFDKKKKEVKIVVMISKEAQELILKNLDFIK